MMHMHHFSSGIPPVILILYCTKVNKVLGDYGRPGYRQFENFHRGVDYELYAKRILGNYA